MEKTKIDLSNKNVIHVYKEGIQFLQFRKLLEYKDILVHAYSVGKDTSFRTNSSNNKKMEKLKYKESINNYKKLCQAIDCNVNNLVKPLQKHTNKVEYIERKINKNEPDINILKYENVDGTITDKKNIILASTNADCILFLFFDPVKKVIANIHSGWRGTQKQISIQAIKKMKELGCNPEDIICCIMPSIRKCHFEVKEDVKNIFYKEYKNLKEINEIIKKDKNEEKWFIDTVKINQILLENEGLRKENIIDSGICSVCNKELIHSYRADKEKYGLATAIISLT